MMAQIRLNDGSVREITQEFNSGVKAQMRNPFLVRTFIVTVILFEAEVRMYKSHTALTMPTLTIYESVDQ